MSNFYCAAPWRSLHINPRGDVKTCCAGNPNMLGNLNTNSIEQVLNGSTLKEIRRALAQGQAHDYCSNCVTAEKQGGNSERAWHNNLNTDIDYSTAGDEYHYSVLLDVRWNTTCNLSCNYCDPSASSVWASLKGIPVKSGTRPYYEQVCDFVGKHHSHIKEVALVGGEPLLLPENNRLLEVVPAEALITLITNLNVDLSTNKIFKKLSERNRVGWSMSFDNVGSRFEYVRYGSNWELLQKNIKQIKELMTNQGHHGGIHAVYNIYNATRLCELREFANSQGLSIVWQTLFWPNYLNPFLHNTQTKQLAVDEINKLYESGLATESDRVFFDSALATYNANNNTNTSIVEQQFTDHTQAIETEYHPETKGQFSQLWPELVAK